MITYKIHSGSIPQDIKLQILSLLKAQWPEGFSGKNIERDWISREEFHPTYIVLLDDEKTVVSFVAVVYKDVEHERMSYKTYGLSGMVTHPLYRKQGYGLKLIKKAKEYIEDQDGDIVLFKTILHGFYEKAGFEKGEDIKITIGNPSNPQIDTEQVYMQFLSEKGKKGQKKFQSSPIHFGPTMW